MKKNAGFSLMEALVLLIISALLILASFPVLTKKNMFQGKNISVIKCIQKEGAAELNSPACAATIKGSLYNRNNYLDTLLMFVDDPAYTSQGLKVLKEVCDEGGKPACNKIIDICSKDNKCNLGENNDISFYLKLLPNSSNLSMAYMRDTIAGYYNVGMSNIKAMVDSICCHPGLNLACAIKGVSSCSTGPWQINLDNSDNTDLSNDIAVDNSGNAYMLITTNNDIAVVQVAPDGSKGWELKLKNANVDEAHQIIIAGNYLYVVGSANNGSNLDIALVKISTNGNIQWAQTYTDTQNVDDYGMSLTTDGINVYVVGYSHTRNYTDPDDGQFYTRHDLRLYKINAYNGNLVKSKEYTSYGGAGFTNHLGMGIILASDSYLYFIDDSKTKDCKNNNHLIIGKIQTTDLAFASTGLNATYVNGESYLHSTGIFAYDHYLYISGYNDDGNGVLLVYNVDDASTPLVAVRRYAILGKILQFNSVTADSSGIYLVGTYANNSIVFVKVDINGNILSSKNITASSSTGANGIKLDSIYAYITGYKGSDAAGLQLKLSALGDSNNIGILGPYNMDLTPPSDETHHPPSYYSTTTPYFSENAGITVNESSSVLGTSDSDIQVNFTKSNPVFSIN